MSTATIVVPCYNEATRLPHAAFRQFTCDRHTVRFVFVDDGSTDDTRLVLRSLRSEDPNRFVVHELSSNRGKAEAVRTGVLHAFEGKPDFIGYWDADLATPLETIPAFCDLLNLRSEILMLFGARVHLAGRSIQRRPLRHYLGRLFATAASITLGMSIYDTQCGAKLFRASPDTQALFHEPFATRWLFDIEILARLIQARRDTPLPPVREILYEVPLQEWRDVAGSKVHPGDFPKAFVGLAVIYWTYLRPPAIRFR